MPIELIFSPEVEQAFQQGKPVVALESTVISHGLPPVDNIYVATAMEDVVREYGAVPATIAILSGKIHVGLTVAQIEHLGKAKPIRKCSIRDLPIVIAKRGDGATTVAATSRIAHWAGIKIFATGGIGGVHLNDPFDISADLDEFGQTPVTVVCAGAKAILDLPLTVEKLETLGVPVIGYQTDELPAFYYRQSGLPVDERLDTPLEIAQVMQTHNQLQLKTGILVVNPIPPEYEWLKSEALEAIGQAVSSAEAEQISGKALTPYLLDRVSTLSDGQSKRSNIALLLNNAKLASEVACELYANSDNVQTAIPLLTNHN
ncbi:MAG: pseudouridine-5'-phosphate glycosidase [Chloroflexota bacterium]